MRQAVIKRQTKETDIELTLNLDGQGQSDIDTGVGFLDHMLTLLAFHSDIDLTCRCRGDLQVDSHHTVEDIAIALGDAFQEALGDKKGIYRYGSFTIPMDEALVTTHLDISGRSYLVFHVDIEKVVLGNYETEMTEEFFRAFVNHSQVTLHINEMYGSNTHHIIEACFKSFARAIKQAITIDQVHSDKINSSKGVL